MKTVKIVGHTEDISLSITGDSTDIRGVAIVLHGLGGSKTQPVIEQLVDTFRSNAFRVVAVDFTNSFNESGGDIENATTSSAIEDLKSVVEWVKNQPFLQYPITLVGHSLGGLVSIIFAEQTDFNIQNIVLVASPISGKSWFNNISPEMKQEWKRVGYYETNSKIDSRSGKVMWSFAEDTNQYDTISKLKMISANCLSVYGDQDKTIIPKEHELFAEKISGEAELNVIEGLTHNPKSRNEHRSLDAAIARWLMKEETH